MSNKHKYKLLWNFESKGPDGINAGQVPEGRGACDAMFLASIIYPADGSLSIEFMGFDGRVAPEASGAPGELGDHEWFKVWALLSARLASSKTIDPSKRAFCALVFETFTRSIQAADDAEKAKRGQS